MRQLWSWFPGLCGKCVTADTSAVQYYAQFGTLAIYPFLQLFPTRFFITAKVNVMVSHDGVFLLVLCN